MTAYGRDMIYDSKRFVEDRYGATVVYGDTDSVFIKFPGHLDLRATYDKALEVEAAINGPDGLFTRPIKLEFEKIFVNMLLLEKKRYCAFKYDTPDAPGKLDYKGLELARRDNAPLLKRIMKEYLHQLIQLGDAPQALRSVLGGIGAMLKGELDIADFTVTKALTKLVYVNPQIHVNLAARIKRRAPGEEPKLGDRVPYVVIKRANRPLSERGEDPQWAVDNMIALDYEWYLEKQIVGPMTRLIEPMVGRAAVRLFFERGMPGARWMGNDGTLVSGEWLPDCQARVSEPAPKRFKGRRKPPEQVNKVTSYFGAD